MDKKTRRAFNAEELGAIRNRLTDKRKVLWEEILDDLESEATDEHRNVIDIIKENGDMALEELRESTAFLLIEHRHHELTMIEEALERIEKGEYGRCLDCKRQISPERLEALPYAVRCRNCQAENEKLARLTAQ
jgi:DnaK suppressor protein